MLHESIIPAELLAGGIVIWLILGLAMFCYGLLFEGLYQVLILSNPNWFLGWVKALKIMVSAIPLLGLLGTIIGLLDIFFALSHQAQMSMSDGIAKALFTTQMGMLMTIPAMILLWFLQSRTLQQAEQGETANAS